MPFKPNKQPIDLCVLRVWKGSCSTLSILYSRTTFTVLPRRSLRRDNQW